MGKAVIRATSSGYKFDFRAGNGETVASSQIYASRAACLRGIRGALRAAQTAGVADLTAGDTPGSNPRFELYRDRAGQWRFRLRARNGTVVASSEAYRTRAGCEKGIQCLQELETAGFSLEVSGE